MDTETIYCWCGRKFTIEKWGTAPCPDCGLEWSWSEHYSPDVPYDVREKVGEMMKEQKAQNRDG